MGLLLCERDYGRFAAEGLLRELKSTKVCVAYQEIIPLVYNQLRVQEIMQVDSFYALWHQCSSLKVVSFIGPSLPLSLSR